MVFNSGFKGLKKYNKLYIVASCWTFIDKIIPVPDLLFVSTCRCFSLQLDTILTALVTLLLVLQFLFPYCTFCCIRFCYYLWRYSVLHRTCFSMRAVFHFSSSGKSILLLQLRELPLESCTQSLRMQHFPTFLGLILE